MAKEQSHSRDEIIRVAAEVGAATGIKAYEDEHKKSKAQHIDTRLRNTKLLLRNYRMFKAHCDNAVYDVVQLTGESLYDIIDAMAANTGGDSYIESIKNSVARTVTIVQHIETMLHLYEVYCHKSNRPEEERRYRIVSALYIDDDPLSAAVIAQAENIDTRTVYKDIDAAVEKIAALIFGIDGIKKI